MSTKPRLVVFDVAGTTVTDRDEVNRCLREALAQVGVAVSREAVNQVMGLAKPEAIARLLEDQPKSTAPSSEHVRTIHEDFVARMMDDYRTNPEVAEVPGTSTLFRSLKDAGVAIALDTGFSRDILDVILKRLGWIENGLVDTTVASNEVARGRPFPDMIHTIMKRLGVTGVEGVAKVGDAPADLQEGSQSGCQWVIGVGWGTHTLDQLAGFPHTHLVRDHNELRAALGIGSGLRGVAAPAPGPDRVL